MNPLKVEMQIFARLAIVFIVALFACLSIVANSKANEPLGNDNISGFTARVMVRSSQRVEYRSQIVAPVESMDFLVGDSFNEGDPLIKFDCSSYLAELRAAKANAHAAAIEHKTKRRLLKYQAAGKDEVALAAAQSARAGAELEVHEVRAKSCIFEAPFSGRVVAVNARPHEFPPSDRPMITVINDEKLEMELVVPSQWLVWLAPGSEFDVLIDETGGTGKGRIERIAAEVDPVSQTVRLIAVFEAMPQKVLAGMSGTAGFASLVEAALKGKSRQ